MGNYTYRLSEVIRDMADPHIPDYDFNALIADTWHKIVPTSFPVWKETKVTESGEVIEVFPRKRIVSKILAHYYMYEIGYESQNMWLFAFNRRLGEIMPYYVELAKTLGVEFNPFITTDLEETYGGEEGKEEGRRETNNNLRTGNISRESTGNERNNGNFSDSSNEKSISTLKKTGSDGYDGGSLTTTNYTDTNVYGKTEKNISDKNGSSDSTVTFNTTNTRTKTGTVVEDDDNWNKFSETPQGVLEDVERDRYLTDARKIEDDKTTTYNLTETDKKTGTEGTKGKTTDKEIIDTTYGGEDTLTKTGGDEVNDHKYNYYDTTDKEKITRGQTKSGENNSEVISEGTETSNSEDVEQKETNELKKMRGENSYVKRIKGRNSTNIADQIAKWRELVINIDTLIIEDMKDVFMQVF